MIEVYRRELKYILSLSETAALKNKLQSIMESDSHNGLDGYRVRSLYFDTPFDMDFEEKVAGYDKRQKIRIRIYGDQDRVIKLERKAKEGQAQKKSSLLITKEEAVQMMSGDYEFLMERKEAFAHQLYVFMKTKMYQPKCIVEYNRYAFVRAENDVRITFDSNLRATEASVDIFDKNLLLYPVADPSEVTLEVKYSGFLFSYIKKIINAANRMQLSNSKYCRARMITKKGRM